MWPFSSSYPEHRPEDIHGKTFDYIVVGGGVSGCLIASRLSENPAVTVLVLEKGRVRDNWLTSIPLLSQGYHLPWAQGVNRLSEPVKELGGRRVELWTAEAIGGASRVNGMLLTRGVPAGYNDWARSFGLDDWTWEKVEPFFRKSENAVGHPDAPHRGHSGLVESRQFTPALASIPYYEKAAAAVGLPISRDLNDPKGNAQGYFYLDQTIDARGKRLSAYQAWLNVETTNERKDRLTVCTGVVASRLQLHHTRRNEVTGVHIRPVKHRGGSEDREFIVRAWREVIVCSGTVCTPQLLMLSGIGPKDQLEPNGIPLVHELPAVGSNLTDHYAAPIMHKLPLRHTLHLVETAWGFLWLFLYIFLGKDILAASSTPSTIFIRTAAIDDETMTVKTMVDGNSSMDASNPRNVPNIEIMITPFKTITAIKPGLPLGSLFTTLVQPFSRGRIELASTDPRADPRIRYSILEDKRDVEALRKGTRFAMRLAEQFEKSGYPHPSPLFLAPGMDLDYLDSLYAKSDPVRPTSAETLDIKPAPELPIVGKDAKESLQHGVSVARVTTQESVTPKMHWRSVTDRDIDEYVRRVSNTSLHFSGSCRMSLGPEDGVVDQRLRVHGVKNLRIADASVFPKIPSAHTMAPTMMIAERCAEFLKIEWEARKTK